MEARPDPTSDPSDSRATVFVVDDYEGTRVSLIWLLEAAGMRAEGFATVEAFFAACDGTRPGCIVADLGFHGRQGLELIGQLRAREMSLPLILLDGNGDESAASAAMAGAADCLGKPFRDDVLLRIVEQALRRAGVQAGSDFSRRP